MSVLTAGSFLMLTRTVIFLCANFVLTIQDDWDYQIVDTDTVKGVTGGGQWTFHCPHINPSSITTDGDSNLSVAWLHNGRTLLKIQKDNIISDEELSLSSKKKVEGKAVITAGLFDNRYRIYYDTAVGDFDLTINDARRSDAGLWECKIEFLGDFSDKKDAVANSMFLEVFQDESRKEPQILPKNDPPPEPAKTPQERTDLFVVADGEKESTSKPNVPSSAPQNANSASRLHVAFLPKLFALIACLLAIARGP